MLGEVVCFQSEHSYACKELYEVPDGDQVDGSPLAPVLRFERYSTIDFEKPDFFAPVVVMPLPVKFSGP
eukprot:3046182-Pyramimonas_sp.AAC.2